jgi:hypothetical protein
MAMTTKDKNKFVDFMGFAPDVDQETPGACQTMDGVMPTSKGWRAMPTLYRAQQHLGTLSLATVPSQMFQSRTGHTFLKLGNQIMRVGYMDAGATISSANTATNGLSVHTDFPEAFLDFGLYALMASPYHTIASLTGQVFTAVPGGPGGIMLMVSASRFVVGFDAGWTWRCSARDTHLSWTPSPATLSAFGELPGQPDDLNRTAVAFGDDILLFKGASVYRGRFEPGNAEVWNFEREPVDVSAMFMNVSRPYKQGVVVLADDGLYYYDGAALDNLMDARMARWFAQRVVLTTYLNRVVVDTARDLIWISALLYDSDEVTTYSRRTLVCDPRTKRWAFWNGETLGNIDEGAVFAPGHWSGLRYSLRSNLRTVWGIPNTGDYVPRELRANATAASAAQIVTNDFGHAFVDSELTRAAVKFTRKPTGTQPIVADIARNALDNTATTTASIARADDGLFDVRRNARWHRLKFDIYGDFEATGFTVDLEATGRR